MPHIVGVTAEQLAEEMVHRRTEVPIGNALLEALTKGDLTNEHLKRFVSLDAQCHKAELAAYGTMLARFPHRPAADLYLNFGRLVYDLHPKLVSCARALGMTSDQLMRRPSARVNYAFASALSLVAIQGSQAAGAMALYTDLIVYFPACAELVTHLRSYEAKIPSEFLEFYSDDGHDDLCRLALDVVQDGLDRGDDPHEVVLYARLVDEAFGDYWRAAVD